MVDFTGATPENGMNARSPHSETLRDDTPGGLPARPLAGSSLEALVRRQSSGPGSDGRLGFVPVQIR
ncbi:hypothetical protein [Pengzhenrongella sp.]|jgi:hypothetical protein|uniref:hypothetical protein n=1 Tax=Pengzhenrongella sp. TaxID=2888820 RepID=UPI002F9350C4